MKTLIELYDERPLENVLATEVFDPEQTVFLCPSEIAQSKAAKQTLCDFFKHRGLRSEPVFVETSRHNAAKIERQLRSIVERYEDCALEISGGSDAMLFAVGRACADIEIPVFTYSRKQNCFFDIQNAPFLERMPCAVSYGVEDFFVMAGGAIRTGRVDNSILSAYMDKIEDFFKVFIENRGKWKQTVNYIQLASQAPKDAPVQMKVRAQYSLLNSRSGRVSAPEKVLKELETIGFIKDLSIDKQRGVSFEFADGQIRTWLRDIGSVLELYVYKACIDSGAFQEVRTSVIVDWESTATQAGVSNEIDVMAVKGVTPVFISCKTGEVNTEALNELAVLRDRFGGKMAKAAVVTASHCRAITRHRATELGIQVVDLEDLLGSNCCDNLNYII